MLHLFWKVFKNKKTVIPASFFSSNPDVTIIGEKLDVKVRRLFRGSLAIRQVAAGSDNAVEQELTALTNSYYDVERFGIHFVASPKHADMLMVSGPVSRNMVHALKVAYDCMPSPKIVVAVGDGAINGGIYKGSYATVDGVKNVIPVHFEIPGDPPSPKTILTSLLTILEMIDTKKLTVS
jgi:Ni,Fe-hydrogenase III small subunit